MTMEALVTSIKMKKGRQESEKLVAFQSHKGKKETFLWLLRGNLTLGPCFLVLGSRDR